LSTYLHVCSCVPSFVHTRYICVYTNCNWRNSFHLTPAVCLSVVVGWQASGLAIASLILQKIQWMPSMYKAFSRGGGYRNKWVWISVFKKFLIIISLIVIIISQCIHRANHIVHLLYIQNLVVNYKIINLERSFWPVGVVTTCPSLSTYWQGYKIWRHREELPGSQS
jgi:hypothetical protein